MNIFYIFDCYLKDSVAKGWYNSRYGTHKEGSSRLEHEVGYGTNSNSAAQRRILNVDDLEPVLPKLEKEIFANLFTSMMGRNFAPKVEL